VVREPVYDWKQHFNNPANELCELNKWPPFEDAPVSIWVLWHQRNIACWEQLAANDSMYVEHVELIGEMHKVALKELANDPATGGRRGYWSL